MTSPITATIGVSLAVLLAAGCQQSATSAADAGQDAAAAATPVFTVANLETLRQAQGATLREALDFAQEECGSAPMGFEEGAITTADLNADGRPDYMIDMSMMTCGGENRGSEWCGSGGCSFDIFVSTGDDFHQDSFLGMGPEIVRNGDGLAVSVTGRDGPWMTAWGGEQMDIVQRMDGAPVATHEAAQGEEAAVRAVVASIYDTYVAGFDSGERFPEGVETDGLRAAVQAAADPEIGSLGFDYYCACQDYGDVSYDITGVAVNGNTATVALDFRSYGRMTQMELRMLKVGGRWQVDDVVDSNGSLRAMLG